MKSTADFAADERPKNWRQGILLNSPRNNAPLYALTSMMGSESTDDPEFSWWEEDVQMFGFNVSADVGTGATTIGLVKGGTMLKSGDMLRVNSSGEAIRVVSVVSDTSITVTRAMGPNGSAAGTASAITAATDSKLLYIGSAYREGAPRALGVSFNPTKRSNVTQIFRDPVELTRTAAKTTFRTGDPWKNDRRRAAHKHALGIERALWMGSRYETLEAGQPLRFTDGLLNFLPAANIKTVTAGGVDMDELEGYMAAIFAKGSREKVAWGSIATMIVINQIVRKNGQYNWGPNEKEYGMDVKRLYSPAGTLTFMEHPLFGQAGQMLAEDLFIMDTNSLKYRYITDTVLLKDRQDKGVDGEAEEYLTECGLEVHHADHHYLLKGFKKAIKDD
jgi:hypothetical protein